MESAKHSNSYPKGRNARKKTKRAIYRQSPKMTEDERKLLQEIEETHREMAISLNHFEYAAEPEMIEYYIYQYKAAQIKYGYLLRRIKEFYYNSKL